MPEEQIRLSLSLKTIILLCVLSAITITGLYLLFLTMPFFKNLPNILAFIAAQSIGVLLSQWGVILYYAKKLDNSFDIRAVIGNKERLTKKTTVLMTLVLLIITGSLFLLTQPIGNYLRENAFSWLPLSIIMSGDFAEYSDGILVLTYAIIFVFVVILLPISEEVFFRGFMLPQMNRLGKHAPVLNTALFALYHLWSPWQIVTRFLSCLPLYYMVNKKHSMRIGIYVHCGLNFMADFVFPIALIILAV